jgi:PAS domain S-box-containing protein
MIDFVDQETADEFYNQAPCGYFSHLSDGTIIKINDTLLEWLGYTREEVLGKIPWTDFLTMGSKIYYETHFFPLLQIQDSALEIHFDIRRKNGSILPVLLNTVKLYHSTYQTNFYRSTLFDITQRKSYERELLLAKRRAEELSQKLAEKNEQLLKFAYVVSHDLKSPISNMIMFIELIKSKYASEISSSLEKHLSFLDKSAQKMLQLIQDILNFYKSTDYSYEPEYDFYPALKEIRDIFSSQENVEITIPEHPILVPINRVALEQIFLNLISNGIKYNDSPKILIQIGITRDDKEYVFTIQDNGRGINLSDQEKIFEPFTHLKTQDRFGKIGTGIGLATVKKIVENYKGKLELNSATFKGSLFKITFPIQKKD